MAIRIKTLQFDNIRKNLSSECHIDIKEKNNSNLDSYYNTLNCYETNKKDVEKKLIKLKEEINRVTYRRNENIEPLLIETKEAIKKLKASANVNCNGIIKEGVQLKMNSEIFELNNQLREYQRTYFEINKIKFQKRKQFDEAYGNLNNNNEEEELYLQMNNLTEEQRQEILQNQREINERDKAIDEITISMLEVQDMFQMLNTEIIQQGTLLDRIEFNIEKTKNTVKETIPILKDAEKAQKVGCFVYLLLLLLIFIIVIGMIIFIKITVKLI